MDSELEGNLLDNRQGTMRRRQGTGSLDIKRAEDIMFRLFGYDFVIYQ